MILNAVFKFEDGADNSPGSFVFELLYVLQIYKYDIEFQMTNAENELWLVC